MNDSRILRARSVRGLGALPCAFDPTAPGAEMAEAITACVLANLNDAVQLQISKAFADAYNKMGVVVDAGVEVVLAALLGEVGGAIIAATAGTGAFGEMAGFIVGYVASLIGAYVGAAAGSVFTVWGLIVVAISELVFGAWLLLLNPPDVTTTFGTKWTVGDYVNLSQNTPPPSVYPNNFPAAAAAPGLYGANASMSSSAAVANYWGGSLAGVTPRYFARRYQIFLANPVWLFANQRMTGMCQPPPPNLDPNDPVGIIFTTFPGAFEELSVKQFLEATLVAASSPGKLPFFRAVTPGASGSSPANGYGPDVYPDPNPLHYNPAYVDPGGNWLPNHYKDGVLQRGTSSYVPPWTGTPMPGGQPITANCCGGPCPTVNNNATSTTQGAYYYAACPNLVTNDNTVDAHGRITGQTNVGRGIYVLQVMYPALTADQCLQIFAAVEPAYQKVRADALLWANAQASEPTSAQLGTGSKWNLEPTDVQTILAQWGTGTVDPWGLGPSGSGSGASSSAGISGGSFVKSAAVVGGLAAIGVSAYALFEGISVTRAAGIAYDEAKSVAKRPVTAIERRLHGARGRRR